MDIEISSTAIAITQPKSPKPNYVAIWCALIDVYAVFLTIYVGERFGAACYAVENANFHRVVNIIWIVSTKSKVWTVFDQEHKSKVSVLTSTVYTCVTITGQVIISGVRNTFR